MAESRHCLYAQHLVLQRGLCACRELPESGQNSEEEEEDAEDEAEDEKKDKEAMTTRKLVTKAVLMLLAGTIVCAVISDPMVDAVSNFSKVCTCSMRHCCTLQHLPLWPVQQTPYTPVNQVCIVYMPVQSCNAHVEFQDRVSCHPIMEDG